jgi:hypothetical protein
MSTETVPVAPFVEAWFCPDADLTLRWGRLHGVVYGWQLRYRGRLIDSLVGFPDDGPAVTADTARVWADSVAGPRKWIEQPPRSGAFHTHPQQMAAEVSR